MHPQEHQKDTKCTKNNPQCSVPPHIMRTGCPDWAARFLGSQALP